ncbi:MAG: hypothetical protein GYB68_00875 [Chloroflexi bacterium]|nr:hypothetical protein [Chloroflexota bacterium]
MRDGWAESVGFAPDTSFFEAFNVLEAEARAANAGCHAQAAFDSPAPNPPAGAPCDCSDNLYNCGDFATQLTAQTCYDFCFADVGNDVHQLDGEDGDGFVCETLP